MKQVVAKKDYVRIKGRGRAAQKRTCAHKWKKFIYAVRLKSIAKIKYSSNRTFSWEPELYDF